jgi:hypothetical protein
MDRILAVVFALLLSQAPGFYEAYMVRLAGHVAEAQKNVAGWETVAAAGGFMRVRDLEHAYMGGEEAHLVATAGKVRGDLERLAELDGALTALREASLWQRPWVLVREADPDIVAAAATDFIPSFPLTLEAGLYAFMGMLLGIGFYAVTKRTACGCGRLVCRVCRRPHPAEGLEV